MCAICGIVTFDHSETVDPSIIARMTRTRVHRGPDDDGLFVDGHAGLGFRRLSMIDLSGGQPIFNEDRCVGGTECSGIGSSSRTPRKGVT
jgi:asparagine synthase (glutamine-hydrolysing)